MMSEDKAREKVCPLQSIGLAYAYARDEITPGYYNSWSRCEATGCALWVEKEIHHVGSPEEKHFGHCGLIKE